MPKKREPNIEEIIHRKWLVHYDRKPLDKHLLFGFVLACNDDFTLLNVFDRHLFILDGYCVFLNKDVKRYAVYDQDDYFLCEVIRAKKIVPESPPEISISSWPAIIESLSENFPFFVVETERLHKDECYVGKLKKIKKKSMVLREIDTDACWWDSASEYKFDDLTMIKFGGHYETTLGLVNTLREK